MWFSRKQAEAPAAVERDTLTYTTAYDLRALFTNGTVRGEFRNISDKILQLYPSRSEKNSVARRNDARMFGTWEKPWPLRVELMRKFWLAHTLMSEVAYERADLFLLQRIVTLVNDTLPQLLLDIRLTWANKIQEGDELLSNALPALLEPLVDNLLEDIIKKLPTKHSGLEEDLGEMRAYDAETLQFPQVDRTLCNSEPIIEKVEALAVEWSRQRENQHYSMEDEYVRDELAARYLPDTLALYYNVSRVMPDERQHEVEAVTLQQLDLLEQHLQHLADKYANQALAAMNMNSSFLQDTLSSLTESPLPRLSPGNAQPDAESMPDA